MEKKELKVGESITPYGFVNQYSILELEEVQETIEDRIIVLKAKKSLQKKGNISFEELTLESEMWTK